jgi:uncharacterized protein (TIGR02996 family)
MAVSFVYRSHYEGPSGKHLARFDDPTVLDWFRNRWRYLVHGDGPPAPAAGTAVDVPWRSARLSEVDARLRATLGCDVYGLSSLFEQAAENGLPAPRTDQELADALDRYLYVEGEVRYQPHLLQALTDDDEIQLAYYFFDDHYLARHGKRAAFLLNDGWRLPGGHAEGAFRPAEATTPLRPAGRGEGTTYLAFLAYYDSGNLDDIEGGYRIKGVRLPDLPRQLARSTPADWPFELRLLRSQLFQPPAGPAGDEAGLLQALLERPADEASWSVYADWLHDHGEGRPGPVLLRRALEAARHWPVAKLCNQLDLRQFLLGAVVEARAQLPGLVAQLGRTGGHDPGRCLVHAEDHLAQLCLHTDRWGERDLYHQWLLFDDRWAAAHPDLANAVLRFARRWDVLSPGRAPEE